MKLEDIYRIAIETRNFEIKLFWQRSNYFMALNTAIAVGFFSLNNKAYAPILAFLGAIVSVAWFLVNLGSKFWQSRWERRADILEKKLEEEFKIEINLFSASRETILEDVENSFNTNEESCLKQWINKQVMKKPSVSFQMTILSLIFVAFWLLMLIFQLFSCKTI